MPPRNPPFLFSAFGQHGLRVDLPLQPERERGSEGKGEQQRSEQSNSHGYGKRAEETPRDLGNRNQGEKHDNRGNSGKDQRPGDLVEGLTDRSDPRLSRFAMNRDVLDHHDRVVDHQPDGCSQAAQGHQVEALASDAEKENGHRDGDRNNQAGDQRRRPVVEKQEEDYTSQH